MVNNLIIVYYEVIHICHSYCWLYIRVCWWNFPLCYTATMFMEHWKRRQMRLNYVWDLTGFEDSGVSYCRHTHVDQGNCQYKMRMYTLLKRYECMFCRRSPLFPCINYIPKLYCVSRIQDVCIWTDSVPWNQTVCFVSLSCSCVGKAKGLELVPSQ